MREGHANGSESPASDPEKDLAEMKNIAINFNIGK